MSTLRLNHSTARNPRLRPLAILGLLTIACCSAYGWPPAPPHTLFGMLRDEFGGAITRTDARVVFEADNGVRIETRVVPGIATAVNYELLIPMDAGLTSDLYRPNAMRPYAPFRLKVIIGNQTFVPIEMSGSLHSLGEPAGNTRLDLTMGLDSDGDGLPDAWKDMVIGMLGGGLTRADITPGGDIDGDGMSNFDEYIAGTYAWDGLDRLDLVIVEKVGSRAKMEFLAIDGRTYFIEASNDLRQWRQVPFRIPGEDAAGAERAAFLSPTLRILQIEAHSDPALPVVYRLGVR